MIAGLYKYNFLAPILVRSPWSRGAVETTCRCSRHLDTGRGGGGGGGRKWEILESISSIRQL